MNKYLKNTISVVGGSLTLGLLCLGFNSLSYLPESALVSKADNNDMQVTLPPTLESLPAVASLSESTSSAQEMALLDVQNRLSAEFAMPKGMEKRIAFWLDVYSKYDSKNYVIHHRELPWIVFDVVDTTDLFKIPRNAKWLNRRDADNLAESRKKSVLGVLKKLSKRHDFENLLPEEEVVMKLLEEVPGSRKSVIKNAIAGVRIQLGQKDMFESGLVNSAPYLPMMEKVFIEKGLPKELTRIPLVESSFNLEAHSRVGALGVWQIMPSVARGTMLMNEQIDERQSPLKATVFAAKMLKQNMRALKSWPLAVTSYNHGIGSLMKAVKKLKTSELQEIIDRNDAQSFQFASSNFYACFNAALRAEFYSKELFPELARPEGMKLSKMVLPKSTSLDSLAKKMGLTVSQIQKSNSDIPEKAKPSFKLPAGFQIFVPEKKDKVVENSEKIQNAELAESAVN